MKESMKIYISGAISDNPNYKAEFAEAEKKLKAKYPNAEIVNPARLVKDTGNEVENFKAAFRLLMKCNAIASIRDRASMGFWSENFYANRCNYKVISF